ncbi:hypothetical protein E2C01_059549 [Portunus trituberculatus]|uniref:Uncharacterized protein n=1 Tax=Portunus trituberculatus TaxID=210409 RepID=A0A5B7H702_PORTR|nr:hypothetical protein [Portunus trituberculatus]
MGLSPIPGSPGQYHRALLPGVPHCAPSASGPAAGCRLPPPPTALRPGRATCPLPPLWGIFLIPLPCEALLALRGLMLVCVCVCVCVCVSLLLLLLLLWLNVFLYCLIRSV